MPPSTIYVSNPTVSVEGQANDQLTNDLLAVFVEETTEGLYRCEASFNNYSLRGSLRYTYLDRDLLDFGKQLTIQIGPPENSRQVFDGRISALEAKYTSDGTTQLVVLAEDRLQDLRLTRRSRSFEDVSDEDVINQIASDHSLTPDLEIDGPTYKVLVQVNQSDLAFLRERARCVGVELWVEGTTLFARSRSAREGGSIDLEYGANLTSFSVRADLAHQVTELGISGWDVAAKEAIDETADESAISSELNGDTGGSSILEQAFASRKEYLVHFAPLTTQEARAIAKALYQETARCFITGTGHCDGDARIRVGSTVNISGLGGLFSGAYYVTKVRHTFTLNQGFRTVFDVERPGLGQP